jgi:hypothetical protein
MSLFILGAGFSQPAGMPLGDGLFPEIVARAKSKGVYELLQDDIRDYLVYLRHVHDKIESEDTINLEQFISYLDIEHYLGLRGKDTWSTQGNESQLVIRNLIALVLHERQQDAGLDWTLYEEFVRRLGPLDYIISFNYDTILETAFRRLRKPFRLFPTRYESVSATSGTVDSKRDLEETVILKMHGSIDWFNIAPREHRVLPNQWTPHRIILANKSTFHPTRIIEGPYFPDSPLNDVYRVDNLGLYFELTNFISPAPLLLSPSFNKIVYVHPLKEFWWGFNSEGTETRKFVIIGFLFPSHDEYVKQALFWAIHNFQNYDPNELGFTKTNLKVVDYQQTDEAIATYKQNLPFVDWNRTDAYFNGFREDVLGRIFDSE